jgi:hypothetical protein
MQALTPDMQRVVTEQRLGFVATVDADGTPSVSPKGTFMVLDDHHIAFGEIRSPRSLANIDRQSRVEVNFVDPFARRGYRFKGPARVVGRNADDFGHLHSKFAEVWPTLADRMRAIVVISVERALPLVTPSYDIGQTEEALRRHWALHFRGLQPGGRYAGEEEWPRS